MRSEFEDHYVDAFRYAMFSLGWKPKLKWYRRFWNWIKNLLNKIMKGGQV